MYSVKRHFSECADRLLAKKFTKFFVKHTEKFCLMRVLEKLKYARICFNKIERRTFSYDFSRMQARSDNLLLKPFCFCSVMRVLQQLKSVKAAEF